METSKSKPSPQELFNNKKEFSNKVHARNLKGITDISTHTDNLKIVNDQGKRLFLNAINYYCRDLSAVIFQLREVTIKINDEQSVHDLRNVIVELSKIVPSIQVLLNLEIEEIKIQLKDILSNIHSQVENLLKIVECDDLHEYKQKVLDCQLDMVVFTDALKFHLQHFNLSLVELEKVGHETLEKIRNNLQQIKGGHDVHIDDFVHYMRHSIHHFQKHIDHLTKLSNTENFQNDVRDAVKSGGSIMSNFVESILETLRYDNPMVKMLDVIDDCQKLVAAGCEKFHNIFQSDSNNPFDDFVISLFIFAIAGANAMNHCIEDVIMKK